MKNNTFGQPIHPDPAITLLLASQLTPENTTVTVEATTPTSPYGCVIRRAGRTLQHQESQARMAAAIRAMLRESARPWTVNGEPLRGPDEPIEPPLQITASLETQEGGNWREKTLAGPPEISVNCRVEDVLAELPGMDRLAHVYLTELPSDSRHHAPVGRVKIRPVRQLGIEALDQPGRLADHSGDTDDALEIMTSRPRDLPAPIDACARTWVAPRCNHPRELSRCRRDVRPIIVHGVPVVIRCERLDWAEQTSAIITLEQADTELVPVIATFINPGGRSDQRAIEAWAEIDPESLTLTLRMPGGTERRFPMPMLARGQYSHRENGGLDVRLGRKGSPQSDLAEQIIRCYEPSLRQSVGHDPDADEVTAALALARMAQRTAREAAG